LIRFKTGSVDRICKYSTQNWVGTLRSGGQCKVWLSHFPFQKSTDFCFQPTNLDNVDDEQLRFLLASNNIDITENGTLRRKKKHHRSSREHHRHPKEKDETGVQQEESKKASESYFGEKIERKARRHR